MISRNKYHFPARVLAVALMLGAASAGAETDDAAAQPARDKARSAAIDAQSRELALDAHRTAASAATEAVLEATRLDLDIRLIGRSSVTVASES